METKKPKVSLISYTKDPITLMCWTRRVMHSKVPDTLEELKENPKKWLGMSINKYFNDVLLNDGMPTFLEYVNLTFKLENVSRALTHQLVRHRIGFSYSQQSMRCVKVESFADDGSYHMPDSVKNKKDYHQKMVNIQELYKNSLEDEVNVQDARGLLPTNIQTSITFNCSLRALIGMVNKRLCLKTQGEFRIVADQISEHIKKIDKRLMKYIGAPCIVSNYCMMKGENEEQYKKREFKGKQNTDHVCPLYMKIYKNDEKK